MSQYKMTAVPREMRADFVYIASGNGMAGYGIQCGDDVYIRQQDTADNGDIVAILVDGAVLLRCIFFQPSIRKFLQGDLASIHGDAAFQLCFEFPGEILHGLLFLLWCERRIWRIGDGFPDLLAVDITAQEYFYLITSITFTDCGHGFTS